MISILGKNYTKEEWEYLGSKTYEMIKDIPCCHICKPSKCLYYRVCHDLAYTNSHIIENIDS